MIDNGIKRIDNLACVGYTLVSLTLCDQNITHMENLYLPNLRELFMHRNKIVEIDGLEGCQRLRKLWLFQNFITNINNLHNVPELEELWLHANKISSLDGIQCVPRLANLGISGNPITEFSEINHLIGMNKLVELTLSDVHFGRTPITDDSGYKEYIMCHLSNVQILDGVLITSEHRLSAHEELTKAARNYDDAFDAIEEEYRCELQALGAKHKQKETHCAMLENEMSEALGELQNLVESARKNIQSHMTEQQSILDASASQFHASLERAALRAQTIVTDNIQKSLIDFDINESSFLLLERILSAEKQLLNALCHTQVNIGSNNIIESNNYGIDNGGDDGEYSMSFEQENNHNDTNHHGRCVFHALSDNAPDYQWYSNMVSNDGTDRNKDIAIIKVFRLILPPPPILYNGNKFDWRNSSDVHRIFTVMTPQNLLGAINGRWGNSDTTGNMGVSQIFSSCGSTICALLGIEDSFQMETDDNSTSGTEESSELDTLIQSFHDYHTTLHTTVPSRNKKNKNNTPVVHDIQPVLQRLEAAKQSNILLLVCCRVDLSRVSFSSLQSSSTNTSSGIVIPTNNIMKKEICSDLSSSRKSVSIPIEGKHNHSLYILPPKDAMNALWIEFASLVITPLPDMATPAGVNGTNLVRMLEGRLEAMTLPVQIKDKHDKNTYSASCIPSATKALHHFEKEAHGLMRELVDHIMEEVTPEQAQWLKDVDTNMKEREDKIRSMRDKIDIERKGHDTVLKDLRAHQQNQLNSVPSTGELPTRRDRDTRRR
jgi:hypothetical protein